MQVPLLMCNINHKHLLVIFRQKHCWSSTFGRLAHPVADIVIPNKISQPPFLMKTREEEDVIREAHLRNAEIIGGHFCMRSLWTALAIESMQFFKKSHTNNAADTFQATGCSVDSQKPSHFSLALREQRCRPGKARFSIRPRERKGVKLNSLEGRTAVFRLIFVPGRSTVVE